MQSKDDFLNLYLKHLNTSAIIDVILRILTTVDSNDLRIRSINWLKSVKLIDNLIDTFKHDYDNQIHSNASQLICDIIKISREQILSLLDTEENKNQGETCDKTNEITDMIKNSLLDDIEW